MNYKQFFDKCNIEYQEGLTEHEFETIGEIYGVVFPCELKNMLKEILPISKGFYNWRNLSDNNINYIKSSIARPISDIYELAADVYWNDSWGEEPYDSKTIEEVVRKKILSAPKLIPVFAHRYMPLIGGKQVPIFSIHGADVICYGNNIEQYLKIEFGGMNQNEVDLSSIRSVPFWSELL